MNTKDDTLTLGLFYVLASALPSTLGANAGLLSLPGMTDSVPPATDGAEAIARSTAWIATAAVAVAVFVVVLGRGLTLSR